MNLSKPVAVCLALFLVVGVFSVAASADPLGVRGYGTPYTDVSAYTWSDTYEFNREIYDDEGNHTGTLAGTVDWIVYGSAPGDFPYTDSGYTPLSNQYTYVYQITNSGNVTISEFSITIEEAFGNVGSFVSDGRVEGKEPIDNDWAIQTPDEQGFVTWYFTGEGNGIGPGGVSSGLVFNSPKAPTTTSTGRITNGGHSASVDIPAPGPNDIPEPGTLALMGVALGMVVIGRRSFRR